MRLDRMLKNMLQNVFQKKNYKYFIILGCIAIMVFFTMGNYNLVLREGATLSEKQQSTQRNNRKALETQSQYQGIEEHYNKANKTKNIEGMTCGNDNYFNGGVKGNNGANSAVNKMCNITKKTCQENGQC